MSTNKKPRIGGMIAKVTVGAIFILVGVAPDPEFDAGGRGMGIILGLALIAWALLPYFSYKKHYKAVMDEIDREEKEIASIKEALRNKPRKCPHCGATTRGMVCEYCGSTLKDEG